MVMLNTLLSRISAATSANLLLGFCFIGASHAAEIFVSGPAAFSDALQNAVDGDILILSEGDYGDLVISGQTYSPAISIKAATPNLAPVFASIDIRNGGGIHFENVAVTYGPTNAPHTDNIVYLHTTNDIHFDASLIVGADDGILDNDPTGIMFRNSAGLSFVGGEMRHLFRGLAMLDSDDITVTGSVFQLMSSDGIVGRGSQTVLIENNLFTNFQPDFANGVHPDAIQFWNNLAPRKMQDIIIRGNVITRGQGGRSQGIFINGIEPDLPTSNILIEHNVIHQTMGQGIFVDHVDGVTIRQNSVLPFDPGIDQPGIEVRAPFANVIVENNLYAANRFDQATTSSGNIQLEYDNPWSPSYAEIFVYNPNRGAETSPSDLRALSNTGAQNFVETIGGFAASTLTIAHQRSAVTNLSQFQFMVPGHETDNSVRWQFLSPDASTFTKPKKSPTATHDFTGSGYAVARAQIGNGKSRQTIEKLFRIHPKLVLDLTIDNQVLDAAPEAVGFTGEPAGYGADGGIGHAVFNGLAPATGGKFLIFDASPLWGGAPRMTFSARLRRANPPAEWQSLAVAAGIFDIRIKADQLYITVWNDTGQATVLNASNAGLSDGAWHDLEITYDGLAGELRAMDGPRLIASVIAPTGALAFLPTRTLQIGGVSWLNSFGGDIQTVRLSR